MQARVFEAVELADGSIRIVMDIGSHPEGIPIVAVEKRIAKVEVVCGGIVSWEGIFHLPFAPSEKGVSCIYSNSFLELVVRPPGRKRDAR
jgi:hypothetical protein